MSRQIRQPRKSAQHEEAGEHAAVAAYCATKLRKAGYVTLPRALDEAAVFIEQIEGENSALREQLPQPGGIVLVPAGNYPDPHPLAVFAKFLVTLLIGYGLGWFA
jgi:hypothetical protein